MIWTDLNRTRLECKVCLSHRKNWLPNIWIEPDWNVKCMCGDVRRKRYIIWIEPDWNVKRVFACNKVNYVQNLNRTRLECKAVKLPNWANRILNLNRTRLECKDTRRGKRAWCYRYLNRTRLECKESMLL